MSLAVVRCAGVKFFACTNSISPTFSGTTSAPDHPATPRKTPPARASRRGAGSRDHLCGLGNGGANDNAESQLRLECDQADCADNVRRNRLIRLSLARHEHRAVELDLCVVAADDLLTGDAASEPVRRDHDVRAAANVDAGARRIDLRAIADVRVGLHGSGDYFGHQTTSPE